MVGVNDAPASFRPNPHFPSNAPGHVPDNKNFAIHYPADTRPLVGGWLALYLARAVTLAFGFLLLVSVYGLASELAPGRWTFAAAATAVVALNPQVIFTSGVVSNDVPAAAMAGLTLWVLARLIKREPTQRAALFLGLWFGLATLCKSSNLVLVLPVLGGVGWLWHRRGCRWAGASALWVALGAVGTAGWWHLRNWVLYGAPLGLSTHYVAPWSIVSGVERAGLAAEWREVFTSFWAAFGWGNIKFQGAVYVPLGILLLAALAGLAFKVVVRLQQRRRPGWAGVVLGLLALNVLGLTVALQMWMGQVRAPHGRLLFVGLPAIAVLLVAGWQTVHRGLAWLGVGYLGATALLSPPLLIGPAFEQPATAPPSVEPSLGWRIGEVAELSHVEPRTRSVAAGGVLEVDLCWRPLRLAERDYSFLVHLVGPENAIVARRYSYPGLGSYPTSVWDPDRPFCDRVRLDIPADLSRTLRYWIEVGMMDWQTRERLPIQDAGGALVNPSFAGAVRLSVNDPSNVTAPDGTAPIRLADYSFSVQWQAGVTETIQLVWWSAEPVAQDYTVFVHLRHPETGEMVAQGDGPPVGGWYPTSWWMAGEAVTDVHAVPVPAAIENGTYPLFVGLYLVSTGELLGPEYGLGMVEVSP
jgi:hypothetical protein